MSDQYDWADELEDPAMWQDQDDEPEASDDTDRIHEDKRLEELSTESTDVQTTLDGQEVVEDNPEYGASVPDRDRPSGLEAMLDDGKTETQDSQEADKDSDPE